MAQHLDLCRDDIALLAHRLADARAGVTAAARAQFFRVGNIVLDAHARYRVGQRLAPALFARVFGNGDLVRVFKPGFNQRRLDERLSLVEQPELVRIGLLRLRRKLLVQCQPQLLFEDGDVGCLARNQSLQTRDIARQVRGQIRADVGGVAHGAYYN